MITSTNRSFQLVVGETICKVDRSASNPQWSYKRRAEKFSSDFSRLRRKVFSLRRRETISSDDFLPAIFIDGDEFLFRNQISLSSKVLFKEKMTSSTRGQSTVVYILRMEPQRFATIAKT